MTILSAVSSDGGDSRGASSMTVTVIEGEALRQEVTESGLTPLPSGNSGREAMPSQEDRRCLSSRPDFEGITGHNDPFGTVGQLDLEAIMILAMIHADGFGRITRLQNRNDFTRLNVCALSIRRRRCLVYAANLCRLFDHEGHLVILTADGDY